MPKKRKLNSKNPKYHKVDTNAPKIIKKQLNNLFKIDLITRLVLIILNYPANIMYTFLRVKTLS